MAIAALSFAAGGYATFMLLMLLGVATGVIAMCSTAPDWWAYTLMGSAVVLPLIVGIVLALKIRGWYMHRDAGVRG